MDIQITEHCESLQVLIRCPKADDRVQRLHAHIAAFDQKLRAKNGDTSCFVPAAEVLYFESVDDRTFLYTAEAVMEVGQRLYELELILPAQDFQRVSKSVILNMQKVTALHPELNRTLTATLCSGEKLSISRKYVPAVRKLLAL